MEIALIYATKHNHTKKVVDALVERATFKFYIYNVASPVILDQYDLILVFCPTYGDEELPLNMEDFLQTLTCKQKKFVICELGNYYGYDDYEFGAMKIIKHTLLNLEWTEFMQGLSLDSLPKINWDVFYNWCERLNNAIH